MNYYNEIEPFAAQWMRNLINAGHIAPGIVDERSIEDVRPDDLRGFTQCHFFAGIGVWSYALRLAGWPDERPVWTGSCPCQPFSQAGEGSGFDDERHLWPHFHWLIQERRPPAVLGEQVASKDAGPWLDLVHADLEGLDYAFGAVPFPSASVGAPHIRDRLFWVAHANSGFGRKGRSDVRGRAAGGDAQPWAGSGSGGVPDRLAHNDSRRCSTQPGAGVHDAERHTEPCGSAGGLGHAGQHDDSSEGQAASSGQPQADRSADQLGRPGVSFGRMGDANGEHAGRHPGTGNRTQAVSGLRQGGHVLVAPGADGGPGPTNGFWRDADWLLCRDGKWRPVEPGTFPLAHGAASRVGRLRAYGNAINAEAARVFIEAVMECAP